MSIAEKSKAAGQSGVMPMMTAIGYCGIAWAALLVGMVAASLAKWPLLFVIGYVGAGVFLNRTVLGNLIQWHPMYNKLDSVFQGEGRSRLLLAADLHRADSEDRCCASNDEAPEPQRRPHMRM